jgi:hypothetical protein
MCQLENIDELPTALEVPRTLAGVAFVRAPMATGENHPLLVLYAEGMGGVTRTYSVIVTDKRHKTRVPIGNYPPVVPKESGVIPRPGGIEGMIIRDEGELAVRPILGDRHWCGSLRGPAGADCLTKKLKNHPLLAMQLNDLTRHIRRRWGLE